MSTSSALALEREIASRDVLRRCGDLADEGAGVYRVKARGFTCHRARRVARQWEDDCEAPGCLILGFRCHDKLLNYEVVRINRRRDTRP
jgi:hypothetical protein